MASAFVILALLALVITPVSITWRLEALQAEDAATTGRAHALTDSLKTLFVDEIILLQHIREGDTLSAAAYRAVRTSQERLIGQLRDVAPKISADATARVNAVAQFSARWHMVPDAVAARRISERQAVGEMTRILADRDSMFATEQQLDSDIDRVAETHRTDGAQLLHVQRTLSLWLGVLAAIATMVVAWFAQRERRLARALGRSIAIAEHRRADLEAITESRNRLMRDFPTMSRIRLVRLVDTCSCLRTALSDRSWRHSGWGSRRRDARSLPRSRSSAICSNSPGQSRVTSASPSCRPTYARLRGRLASNIARRQKQKGSSCASTWIATFRRSSAIRSACGRFWET